MKQRTLLAAALVTVTLLGCSVADIPNPFDREGGGGPGRLRVRVDNLNFNDATLHLVTGGSRSRLGVVTGKSNGSFSVEWSLPRTLWIDVDLVGEGVFTTNSLDGRAGETVQLLIESDSRRTRLIHGTR